MRIDHYPATDSSYSGHAFDVTKGSIYPYVKNDGVYVCPTDSVGRRSGNSYAANSCIFTTAATGVGYGKALATFDATSDWMLLGEEAYSDSTSDTSYVRSSSTDDGYLLYLSNTMTIRHMNGSNVSFIDGHSKWYRPETVLTLKYQTGGAGGDSCP